MSATPARPAAASLPIALAGASATLTGNGLGRFSYVPLFPAMVAAGWVSGGEAAFLGAVNLSGYLVGVLGARSLASRLGTPAALNAGMALVVVSLGASAWHAGVPWLTLWRGVAGIAGGILMALAGPAVQGAVDVSKRGLAGGITLAGVAAGVVASAVVVPAFLRTGVAGTWFALSVCSLVLWVLAARAWPTETIVAPRGRPIGAWPLYISYSLSAAAFVPHMVYFADLVARGRSFGIESGALAWLLFGIGGLPGPILVGRLCDRVGALNALRITIALQVVSLALVFVPGYLPVMTAAALGGFAAIGLPACVLARGREIAGPAAGAVWVRATAGFAIAQAVTGFGLAALFARTGSHDALFATALALAAAALFPTFVRRARPA